MCDGRTHLVNVQQHERPDLTRLAGRGRNTMLQEEAFRLRKESTYHDANLQWREMKFWLDQLTSYSQQARTRAPPRP